ncbi:hypothetical protein TWF481_007899 [Arthrobotrys musiformis]|uniref:Uncharacterized protein n=1 Tax=Arthrobotrys musiformis TaxID=47236 RepID=A0AAV9W7H8_9PEZI
MPPKKKPRATRGDFLPQARYRLRSRSNHLNTILEVGEPEDAPQNIDQPHRETNQPQSRASIRKTAKRQRRQSVASTTPSNPSTENPEDQNRGEGGGEQSKRPAKKSKSVHSRTGLESVNPEDLMDIDGVEEAGPSRGRRLSRGRRPPTSDGYEASASPSLTPADEDDDADDEKTEMDSETTRDSASPEKMEIDEDENSADPEAEDTDEDDAGFKLGTINHERKGKRVFVSQSDDEVYGENRKRKRFGRHVPDETGTTDPTPGGFHPPSHRDSAFGSTRAPRVRYWSAPQTWESYGQNIVPPSPLDLDGHFPQSFYHLPDPIIGYVNSNPNSREFARRWCRRRCSAWQKIWDIDDVDLDWLEEFLRDIIPKESKRKSVYPGMMATAYTYRAVQIVQHRFRHESMISEIAGSTLINPDFLGTIPSYYRHYCHMFPYLQRFRVPAKVDGKIKYRSFAQAIGSVEKKLQELRRKKTIKEQQERGLDVKPDQDQPTIPFNKGYIFARIPYSPYIFERWPQLDPMHPFRIIPTTEERHRLLDGTLGVLPMQYGLEEWLDLVELIKRREDGGVTEPLQHTRWRNRCILLGETAQDDTETSLHDLLVGCQFRMIAMRRLHLVESGTEVETYGVCIRAHNAFMIKLRREVFTITDCYDLRDKGHQREFLWLVVNAVGDVFWKENIVKDEGEDIESEPIETHQGGREMFYDIRVMESSESDLDVEVGSGLEDANDGDDDDIGDYVKVDYEGREEIGGEHGVAGRGGCHGSSCDGIREALEEMMTVPAPIASDDESDDVGKEDNDKKKKKRGKDKKGEEKKSKKDGEQTQNENAKVKEEKAENSWVNVAQRREEPHKRAADPD